MQRAEKTTTMSERKSSIHINPAKSTSEQHNNREQELNYVFPEHTHENEHWIGESIADREKTIKRLCKQISGRKMQKNAEPIREGVVNLQSHHTMEDLQKLKSDLAKMVYTDGKYEGQKKWRFEIIQMHIHKDEGVAIKIEKKPEESLEEYKERVDKEPKKLDPDRVNYHAHLVFDWQDKENGKMLRYARGQMADLQTDVAKSLGMQRGKGRTADKRTANERLEPIEYKVKQRGKELVELQSEISVLEQKKNRVWGEYCEVLWKTPGSETFIGYLANGTTETRESLDIVSIEELKEAISLQPKLIEGEVQIIKDLDQCLVETDQSIRQFEEEIRRTEEGIEDGNRQNEDLPREIRTTQKGIEIEEANILRLRRAIEDATKNQ